ncbi:MAG TPA: NAD(P)H-binding protein [Terriglobales bacterium]|nr:NAD(P)H-binding protein [Terriglobales bacterium]
MTILVAGATGFVGQAAALRLRERGNQVRGLVRGGPNHPKVKDLQAAGIAIVEGDLTRPETLAAACAGIETIVCTATSMPAAANDGLRRVDLEGTLALIEAAERAGVQRFVYTSYSGNLRMDSPLETAKRTCEDRLLKGRMQAIILRPSYFMEMWLSPLLGFDPQKGSARIYGSGEAKGSYISAFDVAEFAAAAAVKKIVQRQTILEMGGPETVSQLDAVKIFAGRAQEDRGRARFLRSAAAAAPSGNRSAAENICGAHAGLRPGRRDCRGEGSSRTIRSAAALRGRIRHRVSRTARGCGLAGRTPWPTIISSKLVRSSARRYATARFPTLPAGFSPMRRRRR